MMHAIVTALGLTLFQQPVIAFPAPGAATSNLSASAKVAGPVTLQLSSISADITVKPGAAKSVTVKVMGTSAKSLKLISKGKGIIVVQVDGGQPLVDGDVEVELPAKSDLALVSISGDIRVTGVGGDINATTTAGDLVVDKAGKVKLTAVSGDLVLTRVSGAIKGRTVSGDARISSAAGAAARLSFETTSGELEWTGICGQGCAIEVKTLSGDVDLKLDQKSSFDVEFDSFSGDFDDDMKLKILSSKPNQKGGGTIRARYGKGAGKIEVAGFSGELSLAKK